MDLWLNMHKTNAGARLASVFFDINLDHSIIKGGVIVREGGARVVLRAGEFYSPFLSKLHYSRVSFMYGLYLVEHPDEIDFEKIGEDRFSQDINRSRFAAFHLFFQAAAIAEISVISVAFG